MVLLNPSGALHLQGPASAPLSVLMLCEGLSRGGGVMEASTVAAAAAAHQRDCALLKTLSHGHRRQLKSRS